MSTKEERQYISACLMPELKRAFELWAKEYQQERDLGKLGEFANLYRKARKLKTLIWDDKGPTVDPNGWRETERTIIIEVIAHGFLMLTDLDKERGAFRKFLEELDEDEDIEDGLTEGLRAVAQTRREHWEGRKKTVRARPKPWPKVDGGNG